MHELEGVTGRKNRLLGEDSRVGLGCGMHQNVPKDMEKGKRGESDTDLAYMD